MSAIKEGQEMKKHLVYLSLTFLIQAPTWGAIVLKGDLTTGTQSFSFPLGQYAYDEVNRNFFIAALEDIATNEAKAFAISAAGPASDQCAALTPEIVTLNGVPDSNNPLWGQAINVLGLAGGRPLAVLKQDPTRFYLIHNFRNPAVITEFSTPQLNDAQTNPEVTAGIIALTAAELGATEDQIGTTYMFAAVKPHNAFWGEPGSGIALARFISSDNGQTFTFDIPNATTGEPNGNKAAPLDTETPAVFIENPVARIDSSAALHWNERLRLLYIGLEVVPIAGPQNGGRSVVLGFVTNNQALSLQPVVPDSAIENTTSIVGARGGNFDEGTIVAYALSSIFTSTNLDYLIVNGGNGVNIQNQVYALPLVNLPTSQDYGKIADKTQEPLNIFNEIVPSFVGRYLTKAATNPLEMPQTSDTAARVGGGVLPGPVQSLFTFGDTVFASVISTDNNQQGGIFYSQAIFKANGLITAWTPWQRAGATGSIFGFALDQLVGDYFFMTGDSAQTVTTVKRTLNGAISISDYVSSQLPQEQGGAQGLINVPYNTTGFSTTIGQRLSVLIIPGFEKVLFIQNGADTNNIFGPINTDYSTSTFSSDDGSLTNFAPGFSALSISGGALNAIGPVITGGVYAQNNNGYFIVAGFGGIAVLCNADGTGFNTTTGLATEFAGLDSTMRFQKITDLIDVRNLIIDGETIYAVTRTNLVRITITPEMLANNTVQTTVLADINNPEFITSNSSFSDAVINNGFGILATSVGLYYSNVLVNLANVTQEDQVVWTFVKFNESLNSITRIVPVTSAAGFATNAELYILDACVSLGQARIYRAAIDPTQAIPVIPFNDLYIKDIPTFLVSLGNYRNYFATDGAINMITRSKYLQNPVIYELLPPHLRAGVRDQQKRSFMINLNIPQSRAIGPMVRSSTSGSWLIVGDFGIRGNE